MKYLFTCCLSLLLIKANFQTQFAQVFHGCGGATVVAYPSDPTWTSVTYMFQRFEGGSWGTVHTNTNNWHLVIPGDVTVPTNYRAVLRNNVTFEERTSNGVTVNPAFFFNIILPPVPEAVKKKLDAALITKAEKIYTKLKAEPPSATGIGNGAISCYLTNLSKHSIYIMDRVCSEETADANTINNYAALLTNHGLKEGALPLLNFLNHKYPKDLVVHTNITMAWLGLWDIKTPGNYADTCIKFFPSWSHQANYIKSTEKESEGDRQVATEHLKKSTAQAYSAEKGSQLRKLGSKPESNYHKRYLPAGPLGLSIFNYPIFPMTSADVLALSEEWQEFYKELDLVIKEHQQKTKGLDDTVEQSSQKQAQQMLAKLKAANGKRGVKNLMYQTLQYFAGYGDD